ncbi:hypothetical protein Tco_0302760 [Tanacetum coccineum]
MSITKCLASQNAIAKINLHETSHNRSNINLLFNPIFGIPINKQKLTPLITTTNSSTRWNSMIVYANVEPPATPPPPSGSSSGSWKNWVMGILMTFIIPLVTTKGGPIKALLQKVDQLVDTAEHISDVVEAVADKVDKVVEELEDDLPESSQLRKTLDYIENIAERVEKDAHAAGDFIDKVQEMEDKLEDIMEPMLEEANEVAKELKDKEKAKKQ